MGESGGGKSFHWDISRNFPANGILPMSVLTGNESHMDRNVQGWAVLRAWLRMSGRRSLD